MGEACMTADEILDMGKNLSLNEKDLEKKEEKSWRRSRS